MIVAAHILRKIQNLNPYRLQQETSKGPQTIKQNPEILLSTTLKCTASSFQKKNVLSIYVHYMSHQ